MECRERLSLEERFERKRSILADIDRLCDAALGDASEAELVQSCLRLAEDAAQADYSFMGRLDGTGDPAEPLVFEVKGDVGRQFDAESVGREAPGFDSRVAALCDRIMRDGRGLIAHAASDGTDAGPDKDGALNAFMGIPLRQAGRTMGVIGLARREGSFCEEDLEAAKELAPALVQTLGARRAEDRSRTSERRLDSLIGALPQLIWRCDAAGNWTWASPQWHSFSGLGPTESVGRGWLEALHRDDRSATQACWETATEDLIRFDARIREAASGQYRWFRSQAVAVRASDGTISEWIGTFTDVQELKDAQDGQRLLVAELQHRVRNILAIIRSVFGRSVETSGTLEEVADHFRGRLDALARTQSVIALTGEAAIDLENLVRDELLTVGVSDGPVLQIGGPSVRLPLATAESLGLAVHELTTNAIKFGALRANGGSLEIRWRIAVERGARRLVFTWTEKGVPALPVRPARSGFGLELIEDALPYRLRAETKLEFRGGGVACRISLPYPDPAQSSVQNARDGHTPWEI